jgi:hypothetical protein
MDPGDQLYTLDELRCWNVDNLRVLDDERSNKGGASVEMPTYRYFGRHFENSDSDSNTLYLNDSISKEANFLKILNNV